MDRFDWVDEEKLQSLIDAQMQSAQSETWGDGDLTEKIDVDGYPTENPGGIFCDRRMREVMAYFLVSSGPLAGSWKATKLKAGDHVMVMDALRTVVAMPARDRRFFLGYAPLDVGDDMLIPMEWATITDRAPINPTEVAMPLDVIPVVTGGPCP